MYWRHKILVFDRQAAMDGLFNSRRARTGLDRFCRVKKRPPVIFSCCRHGDWFRGGEKNIDVHNTHV